MDKDNANQSTSKPADQNKPSLGDRLIHPAQHIEPGFASVGIMTNKDCIILTSGNGYYKATEIKDNLLVPSFHEYDLIGRSSFGDKQVTALPYPKSVNLLVDKLKQLEWFEDERVYVMLALWSLGTYVFMGFLTYPYIFLTGEKQTGKTKVLNILKHTAFNAVDQVLPTPAVLFRTIQSLRPTMLIDETEIIKDDLKAILNVGYKFGASVRRCEGEEYQPRRYEVYSPKCLANTEGLGDVTEDRCITIVFPKPPLDDKRRNAEVNPKDPVWPIIRKSGYTFLLKHSDEVLVERESIALPDWLNGRERELWSPLLTLASLADKGGDSNHYDDLLGLARKLSKDKGLTYESDVILIELERELDLDRKDVISLRPIEMKEGLQTELNRRDISPKWIGNRLRSLGFPTTTRSKQGNRFLISRDKIHEIKARHGVHE